MKISEMLGLSAFANSSDSSLAKLQDDFQQALLAGNFLSRFDPCNTHEEIEQGGAFVSFELQVMLSCDFAVEIRPQIRDQEVSVTVQVIHLRDGLGRGSQSYRVMRLGGLALDEVITPGDDESFADLIDRIQKEAISQHAALIAAAGVDQNLANNIAGTFWSAA